MLKQIFQTTLLAATAALLLACGGGSGGGPSAGQYPSDLQATSGEILVSGVAAVGAPLVNARVEIKDANSNTATAMTDSNGNYTVRLRSNFTFPIMAQVLGKDPDGTFHSLYSATAEKPSGATVNMNITPATSALLSSSTGVEPIALYLDPEKLKKIDPVKLKQAQTNLLIALRDFFVALGADPTAIDLFTSKFSANGKDALDTMLDKNDFVISRPTTSDPISTGTRVPTSTDGSSGTGADSGSAISAPVNAPGNTNISIAPKSPSTSPIASTLSVKYLFSPNSKADVEFTGFSNPDYIGIDSRSNLFVTDMGNKIIYKINTAGVVSRFVGQKNQSGSKDGNKDTALLSLPRGIVIDPNDTMYVVDNNAILKITPQGDVSTIAGNRNYSGYSDSRTGENALFYAPSSLALDQDGNLLIIDGNQVIRKYNTKTKEVSTIAGVPGIAGYKDGNTNQALFEFGFAGAITTDKAGNMYVADNNAIRQISKSNDTYNVSTLMKKSYSDIGILYEPSRNISVENNVLEFCAFNCHAMIKINLDNKSVSFNRFTGEDLNASAPSLVKDKNGNYFTVEWHLKAIGKVTPNYNWSIFAGKDNTNTGSVANAPKPKYLWGMALRGTDLYSIDEKAAVIRKTDINTGQTTYFSGLADSSAPNLRLFDAWNMVVDKSGSLFIPDASANVIWKINSEGKIQKYAGDLNKWGSKDGTLSEASLDSPRGIAIDGNDNLYISEMRWGERDPYSAEVRVRKITPEGQVSTIRGALTQETNLQNSIKGSVSIAVTKNGKYIYLIGAGSVIYRVDTTNNNQVSIVAGLLGYTGSVRWTAGQSSIKLPAALSNPASLCLSENEDSIYISEYNSIIRKIDLKGNKIDYILNVTGNSNNEAVMPHSVLVNGNKLYFTTEDSIGTAELK